MNCYLAGPMRNVPHFNFPTFFEAAAKWRLNGHTVFNPAERDVAKYGDLVGSSPTGNIKTIVKRTKGQFSLRECLAADCYYICNHADTILMLPNWRRSKGAVAERALGLALGHRIIYLDRKYNAKKY
jgi:hypothetical protein